MKFGQVGERNKKGFARKSNSVVDLMNATDSLKKSSKRGGNMYSRGQDWNNYEDEPLIIHGELLSKNGKRGGYKMDQRNKIEELEDTVTKSLTKIEAVISQDMEKNKNRTNRINKVIMLSE